MHELQNMRIGLLNASTLHQRILDAPKLQKKSYIISIMEARNRPEGNN